METNILIEIVYVASEAGDRKICSRFCKQTCTCACRFIAKMNENAGVYGYWNA